MIGLVLSLAFVVWFFILAGRQGRNPWGWAAAGFLSYSLPVAAWALILKATLPALAIRVESEAGAIALGLAIGLSAVAIGTISAVLVRRRLLVERAPADDPVTVTEGETAESSTAEETASPDLQAYEPKREGDLAGAISGSTGVSDADSRAPRMVTVPTLVAASSLSLLVGVLGGMAIRGLWSDGPRSVTVERPSPERGEGVDREPATPAPVMQPQSAGEWEALGNLFFDAGRYSEAIKAYRRSLQLDSSNADVWTDLAISHRRTGQPVCNALAWGGSGQCR